MEGAYFMSNFYSAGRSWRTETILAAALLAGALFASALAGETPQAAPPADSGAAADEIIIIIKGQLIRGRPIPSATETEFQIKLADTGDVMRLRWADLEEAERRRVQKLYGIEVVDGRRVFGEKIIGVRYHLENNKTIAGFPIPERDLAGYKALKTATSPLLLIPVSEIKSEE